MLYSRRFRPRPRAVPIVAAGLATCALMASAVAGDDGLGPRWGDLPLERGILWRSAPGLTSSALEARGAAPLAEGVVRRRHEIRGELVTYWRQDVTIYRCVDHWVRDLGFIGGYCDRAEGNGERWGEEVDRALRHAAPNRRRPR